jgi:hypothetical protein
MPLLATGRIMHPRIPTAVEVATFVALPLALNFLHDLPFSIMPSNPFGHPFYALRAFSSFELPSARIYLLTYVTSTINAIAVA